MDLSKVSVVRGELYAAVDDVNSIMRSTALLDNKMTQETSSVAQLNSTLTDLWTLVNCTGVMYRGSASY